MPNVRYCAVVDLPPEPLWILLSDYRGWKSWFRHAAESAMDDGLEEGPVGVGATRIIGDPESPRARQKLMGCDEERLEVSYMSVGQFPYPVRHYIVRVRLIPLSDSPQTVVEWSGKYDADRADEAVAYEAISALYRQYVRFLADGARALGGTPWHNLAGELDRRVP